MFKKDKSCMCVFKKHRNLLIISLLFVFGCASFVYLYLKEKSSAVIDVRVTNISSTSATITWMTKEKTRGSIIYSKSDRFFPVFNSVGKEKAYDDRDTEEVEYGKYELSQWGEYYVHHVTIRDLKPDSKYYYRISTGLKTADEQTYYPSFETGPVIEDLVSPDPMYGLIRGENEEQIENDILVYLTVYYENPEIGITEESAKYSTVSVEGSYSFDVSNVRSRYLDKLFIESVSGKTYMENVETVTYGYKNGILQIDSSLDQPANTLILEKENESEQTSLNNYLFGEVYAEETTNVNCNHANDTGVTLATYEECCGCRKKKKVVKCEGKDGYDQFHWGKCEIDTNECSGACPSDEGQKCKYGECSNKGGQINWCESKYCDGNNKVCKEKYCDSNGCIQYKPGRYDTCKNGCENGKYKDGEVSGGSGGTCANQSAAPYEYRCKGSKCGKYNGECEWIEVAWKDVSTGECNSCRASGDEVAPPVEQEDCNLGDCDRDKLPVACSGISKCPKGLYCDKEIELGDAVYSRCIADTTNPDKVVVFNCCEEGVRFGDDKVCNIPIYEAEGCDRDKYNKSDLPEACNQLAKCPSGRYCSSDTLDGAEIPKCRNIVGDMVEIVNCCKDNKIIVEGKCVAEGGEETVEENTNCIGLTCPNGTNGPFLNDGGCYCTSAAYKQGNNCARLIYKYNEVNVTWDGIPMQTKECQEGTCENDGNFGVKCVTNKEEGSSDGCYCDSSSKNYKKEYYNGRVACGGSISHYNGDDVYYLKCEGESNKPSENNWVQVSVDLCKCDSKTEGWEDKGYTEFNPQFYCGTSMKYKGWIFKCNYDSSSNKKTWIITEESQEEIPVKVDYRKMEDEALEREANSICTTRVEFLNTRCTGQIPDHVETYEGDCYLYRKHHRFASGYSPVCWATCADATYGAPHRGELIHEGECVTTSSSNKDLFLISDVYAEEITSINESGIYEVQGATVTSGSNELTYIIDSDKDSLEIKFFNDENENGQRDEGEEFLDSEGIKLVKKQDIVSYTFDTGWKLVSFPLVSDEIKTAKNLLTTINDYDGYATHIATYRNGKWQIYSQRGDISFSDDFNILPGVGYFIRIHQGTVVNITGNKLAESMPIELEVGWNLVGIYSPDTSYTADSLLVSIEEYGIEADTLTKWDNGKYYDYIKSEGISYGNDFKIFETGGYFLRVKSNGGRYTP